MCVCVCVCVCVLKCACVQVCVCAGAFKCACVFKCACAFKCASMCMCTRISACGAVHVALCVRHCGTVHVCLFVWACVCVCGAARPTLFAGLKAWTLRTDFAVTIFDLEPTSHPNAILGKFCATVTAKERLQTKTLCLVHFITFMVWVFEHFEHKFRHVSPSVGWKLVKNFWRGTGRTERGRIT